MKPNRWWNIFFLIAFSLPSIHSQDSTNTPKTWLLSGYQKSLHGIFQISEPAFGIDETLVDGFLHNRLNFEWFPSDQWTFHAQLRTRLFYGDLVRSSLFPGFKESLDQGNDVLNLQLLNVGTDVIVHSILDRLYLQYNSNDWEISLGRQRINWGINTVWNPHDIFNAFTFTDFDYEERPGSDALRIKKYTGFASSLEFAVKAFDNTDEIVAALLWKVNTKNYDLQFLGGRAFQDWVLGFGWAGPMGQLGFKGEMSYFASANDALGDAFAATVSWDYSFGAGTFVNIGVLYNSVQTTNTNLFSFDLSARNLYPFQWSVFYSINQQFSPLTSGGLSIIHSPISGNPLFINPSFTLSMTQNLDMDLIGQFYFEGVSTGDYRSPTKVIYLRFKYSF